MSSNQPMQRAWEGFVAAVLLVEHDEHRDIFMAGALAMYTYMTTSADRTDLLDRLAAAEREIDSELEKLRNRERMEQA